MIELSKEEAKYFENVKDNLKHMDKSLSPSSVALTVAEAYVDRREIVDAEEFSNLLKQANKSFKKNT